jgi:hypothetical protein
MVNDSLAPPFPEATAAARHIVSGAEERAAIAIVGLQPEQIAFLRV